MIRAAPVLLALGVAAAAASQTPHPLRDYGLSDERIAQAIAEGVENPRGSVGLRLGDSFDSWEKRWTGRTITSGFSAEIFTPYTWIVHEARRLSGGKKTFTFEDVTGDMRAPVLRVVAHPDMPLRRRGAGRTGTSGVDHVVISSTSETEPHVVQPSAIKESFDFPTSGKRVRYAVKTASFDLSAVAGIAALDDDGEFLVIVIGAEQEEKAFTVKTKHFDRLR